MISCDESFQQLLRRRGIWNFQVPYEIKRQPTHDLRPPFSIPAHGMPSVQYTSINLAKLFFFFSSTTDEVASYFLAGVNNNNNHSVNDNTNCNYDYFCLKKTFTSLSLLSFKKIIITIIVVITIITKIVGYE